MAITPYRDQSLDYTSPLTFVLIDLVVILALLSQLVLSPAIGYMIMLLTVFALGGLVGGIIRAELARLPEVSPRAATIVNVTAVVAVVMGAIAVAVAFVMERFGLR